MSTNASLEVTQTLAGLPVSDIARAEEWYGRFFGRRPEVPMEILRDFPISDQATVQVVLDAERAGGGLLTIHVPDIDAATSGLEERGLSPDRDDATSDNFRLGFLTDPDGNSITLVEVKDGPGI